MESYIKNFLEEFSQSLKMTNWKEIAFAIKILQATYEHDGEIFLIGNGGSAAIASHFASDLNKTVFGQKGEKKIKRFQALCLADNTSALTAWANDVGYKKVFAEQLKNFGKANDTLLAISSSGNSENIIIAAKVAKKIHMPIIGFTGFEGGKLIALADAKIHVPSKEYEIVESAHETICHLITTYLKEAIK